MPVSRTLKCTMHLSQVKGLSSAAAAAVGLWPDVSDAAAAWLGEDEDVIRSGQTSNKISPAQEIQFNTHYLKSMEDE